jgi:hypothetical protein
VSGAAERALAFIEAHGDASARRRAAGLGGVLPAAGVLEALPAPSGLDDALALLELADDLRALSLPAAERAVSVVEAAQQPDGSWGGLWRTGLLAGFLAKTPYARPATLHAAGAWLADQWAPEQVKGGDARRAWPAIAAFAHFFANVPHDLSDAALQWCGRELDRGFRTRRWDAVRTARVLLWCDAGAMPGARLGAEELVSALAAEQQPDGGWVCTGPSPRERVAHTLDALTALLRWRY